MSSACKWKAKRTGFSPSYSSQQHPSPPPSSPTVCTKIESCLLLEMGQYPDSLPLVHVHTEKPEFKFCTTMIQTDQNTPLSHLVMFARAHHSQQLHFLVCKHTVNVNKRERYSLVNRKRGQGNLACLHIPQIYRASEAHIGKEGSTSCRQVHTALLSKTALFYKL